VFGREFRVLINLSADAVLSPDTGHVLFLLAQAKGLGQKMRSIMIQFGSASPSEREMTPLLVLSIFRKRHEPIAGRDAKE